MSVAGGLIPTLVQRASRAWRDAIGSGIAVVMAWVLPQWFFGHERPMFAVITAVVCLAPGLPNHFRQTLGMLIGVATGIMIGEAVFFLPDQYLLLRLLMATSIAVFIPALYGLAPVVVIQSGVSAVLILVLGAHDAGPHRMLDVLVGAGVGLVFSQVLMTPDPIRQIESAAGGVLEQVLRGLNLCQEALNKRNAESAERALESISRARGRLSVLDTDLSAAADAASWTLRGRMMGQDVTKAVRRYDRHVIRIYASALLFADALFHALRDAPQDMPNRLEGDLTVAISMLSTGPRISVPISEFTHVGNSPKAEDWARCDNALGALIEAIAALDESGLTAVENKGNALI